MPDEANAHWESILMQLTEGQTWLKKHLNVTPISSWSIDPFGLSPTLPYILKHSGFENLLIQRTHYSIKKRLAKEKQLEFRWRQIWGILKQNTFCIKSILNSEFILLNNFQMEMVIQIYLLI